MSQHPQRQPRTGGSDFAYDLAAPSRRAVIQAAFAAAASAVLFGLPRTAHAANATQETLDALSDAQSQYDDAEAQLDEISTQFEQLSQQLDDTMGQIETVQAQIDATQESIDETQDSIDETQESIDEMQAELDEKQEQLAERVTASYKAGGKSTLSLLLSSESFDELISKMYYVDKVNAHDQESIEEINRIQEELERQKAELERQKQSLEDQKAELERQRSDLESLKAQQTEQLDEMKEKKDEVQTLLSSLSQEVTDLIAKRDAEILAAAQAEEEARRAAEAAKAAAAAGGGTTSIPGDGQAAIEAGNAQQLIVQCAYSTPSPGAGLCAAWVSYVFQNAGFGSVWGNADDMYANYCTSSNKSNLKVGMIIAVPSHPHSSAGRIYGHVGIYVGDNTVRDNIGYIRSIDVDQWISYYGATSTPRWGWALLLFACC